MVVFIVDCRFPDGLPAAGVDEMDDEKKFEEDLNHAMELFTWGSHVWSPAPVTVAWYYDDDEMRSRSVYHGGKWQTIPSLYNPSHYGLPKISLGLVYAGQLTIYRDYREYAYSAVYVAEFWVGNGRPYPLKCEIEKRDDGFLTIHIPGGGFVTMRPPEET
jgi:hypothetical protein